jgi:hypothetical protein
MTDTADASKAANKEPANQKLLPPLRGGGGIAAIIPQDFDQAYRMARVIAASGAAPKSYLMKDPTDLKEYISVERIAVAIMAGLEVGLPPMAAVQGIAVINGIPTIYGDARDGLIAASGLLEDMKEEMELDNEGMFLWARCTVWRKGRKTPIVQTVTRPQAARAGWLKKQGPWQESPNRMAQMRAKGWANRDAFPDVLKGLRDRDEVVDMVDVTDRGSAMTDPPPEPRRRDFLAEPANGDAHDPETGEVATTEPQRPWKLADDIIGQEPRRKAILELLELAKVKVDVDEIEQEHADFIAKLGRLRAETMRAFDDRRTQLPEKMEEAE